MVIRGGLGYRSSAARYVRFFKAIELSVVVNSYILKIQQKISDAAAT